MNTTPTQSSGGTVRHFLFLMVMTVVCFFIGIALLVTLPLAANAMLDSQRSPTTRAIIAAALVLGMSAAAFFGIRRWRQRRAEARLHGPVDSTSLGHKFLTGLTACAIAAAIIGGKIYLREDLKDSLHRAATEQARRTADEALRRAQAEQALKEAAEQSIRSTAAAIAREMAEHVRAESAPTRNAATACPPDGEAKPCTRNDSNTEQ